MLYEHNLIISYSSHPKYVATSALDWNYEVAVVSSTESSSLNGACDGSYIIVGRDYRSFPLMDIIDGLTIANSKDCLTNNFPTRPCINSTSEWVPS